MYSCVFGKNLPNGIIPFLSSLSSISLFFLLLTFLLAILPFSDASGAGTHQIFYNGPSLFSSGSIHYPAEYGHNVKSAATSNTLINDFNKHSEGRYVRENREINRRENKSGMKEKRLQTCINFICTFFSFLVQDAWIFQTEEA